MARHVLLTGPPGVGKTTAVKKAVDLLRDGGKEPKGFVTEEVREDGRRIGFDVVSVVDPADRRSLARKNAGPGPKVGQYTVTLKEFEAIGLPTLRSAKPGDLLVVDEIGKMELLSGKFLDAATALFDKVDGVRILCTVPTVSNHAFVKALKRRDDKELIEVEVDCVIQCTPIFNVTCFSLIVGDARKPRHRTGSRG